MTEYDDPKRPEPPERGDDAYEQLAAELSATRQALSESEARYRLIMRSIVDYAIVATDLSGTILLWNEPAAEIFGWPGTRMIGRPLEDLFTPEDVAAGIPEAERRTALEEGSSRHDRWHLGDDGRRIFASGELMPLKADDGTAIGFLKILRDRTEDERRRRELEASRERLQFALDASALIGTWDWDIVSDRVHADSRFAALYGLDAADAVAGLPIERYIGGIHRDDRERVAAHIETAMRESSVFALEYRTVNRAGEVRWIYARGRSFADAAGRPVRFPGAVVDITLEKLRERRQAALLRLGDESAGFGERTDSTLIALQILGETFGIDRVGYASVDAEEIHATILGEWTRPSARSLSGRVPLADFGAGLLSALRTGLVIVGDVASDPVTRDGLRAWESLGTASMVNMTVVEDGKVKVILYLHAADQREWSVEEIGFIRDVLNRAWSVSRRRRAETALINAETRLRLAQEAAEIGTFDHDLTTGDLSWDAHCRAAFGIASRTDPVDLQTFSQGLHPDDRGRVLSMLDLVLDPASDGVFDAVYRTIGRDDARLRTIQANGQTVVEDGRTVRFVGAVRDVTEVKEAEERQILLTRELQHRVKNTLAMVNALANQTLRRAANVQEGLAAFSARLIALSQAHDILTQTSWTSAPVEAIVEQSLATHQTGVKRIRWSGPDVRLTAKQSLALALALHELATNALKYGSLSNEEGRVVVAWHIALGNAQGKILTRLRFEWREEDGPPVTPPTMRGFGSRLIEQSLALEFGGTVKMDYAPGGLVCTIDADLQVDPDEDAILPLRLDEMEPVL